MEWKSAAQCVSGALDTRQCVAPTDGPRAPQGWAKEGWVGG